MSFLATVIVSPVLFAYAANLLRCVFAARMGTQPSSRSHLPRGTPHQLSPPARSSPAESITVCSKNPRDPALGSALTHKPVISSSFSVWNTSVSGASDQLSNGFSHMPCTRTHMF